MKNIAVIFGGKSVEHDISIITGIQVMKNINMEHNIIPIYISRTGQWWTGQKLMNIETFVDFNISKLNSCFLLPHTKSLTIKKKLKNKQIKIDNVILALHGANGEDGCIQGLLELCEIPYTSSGVFGSSVTMDKVACKMILKENDIKTPDFVWFYKNEYEKNQKDIFEAIHKNLGDYVVVKPARAGSSIGVKSCKTKTELKEAINLALCFDNKVIVEKYIQDFREINIAVLGMENNVKLSSLEEVSGAKDVLSFEQKYIDSETIKRVIEPKLEKEVEMKLKCMAERAFYLCECFGVVRLDFFVNGNEVLLNEINSIPGSMANYLFKDVSFSKLLEKMMKLSEIRLKEKSELNFRFSSSALINFKSASNKMLK